MYQSPEKLLEYLAFPDNRKPESLAIAKHFNDLAVHLNDYLFGAAYSSCLHSLITSMEWAMRAEWKIGIPRKQPSLIPRGDFVCYELDPVKDKVAELEDHWYMPPEWGLHRSGTTLRVVFMGEDKIRSGVVDRSIQHGIMVHIPATPPTLQEAADACIKESQ